MRRSTLISSVLAAAVALATVVAACTDGGTSTSDQPPRSSVGGSSPSSVSSPAAPPSSTGAHANRIVSLSPSATEMLFAIGAGDQVVGVDDGSNFPNAVSAKPHLSRSPDLDALAALQPDVVVIADDPSGLSSQLAQRGIAVLIEPAPTSLDLVFDQVSDLGSVSGHRDEARHVAADMRARIDAAVAGAPKPTHPLTYYHEIDPAYTSVTENTLTGQIYSLFGLQSIADFQEVSTDNPKLSPDAIISADPDLIFLADGETPAGVAARPGWSKLKAVRDGNVVVLDGSVSSRWGPRIVDFVEAIADAVGHAGQDG